MNEKIIYFAIRDDDICYFTKPEELEACYSSIWDQCPISLSVVPFHSCTKSGAVPEEYWTGERVFPLEENPKLVTFLRENIKLGRIYVTLHGCHHKDEPDGYEFVTGKNLEEKIIKGKAYLEGLLGQQINIFVPPHNAVGKIGYESVLKAGMDISGIKSFRPALRGWHTRSILLGIKRRANYRKMQMDSKVIVFPDGHCELPYQCLTPSISSQSLSKQLNEISEYGGVFCLSTHYWEFGKKCKDGVTIKQAMMEIWEKVAKSCENMVYCTLGDLCELARKDKTGLLSIK